MSEGVADDIANLTKLTVRSELGNLADDLPEIDPADIDWPRLILAGSILARSERRAYQEAALRIAVAAISLVDDEVVRDAGAVLLDKMSNFRSVTLAVRRGMVTDGLDDRLGISLRLESQRREMDRSILVETTGHWLEVNEFQQRFWTSASTAAWLSASAPTASGKTFVVLQWLIDQVASGKATVAIYLAPTRALVSEIETSLESLIEASMDIEVSSLPLRTRFDNARSGGSRLILVFTQERMHLLANVLGADFLVDLMIVDEAHKIGDDGRGVILQDAVERAVRLNPEMKLVFISPATQNPEELLTDAATDVPTVAVDSDAPTVLQNLLLATQVKGKPRRWILKARQGDVDIDVGILELASTPASFTKRLAFVAAAAAGTRGGTLVYANGAAESEDVADLISQLLPQHDPRSVDPELAALADLARKGVHPGFRLAPLVERGVAFHFGNMPSLLRLEIERLFRSGKLRFLVCTSTLVEGVNLSCRTIVVRGPRKGQGNPMEPHDFWNLAGRAGRWGDEFQGNIICIDPHDEVAWPKGVPQRARYPIKRESDTVLEAGEGLLQYLAARPGSMPREEDRTKYEQVGAYLLTAFMRLGSIDQANFAKRHDPGFIDRLNAVLATISLNIEISADLASRHSGVSPIGMQSLLETFRKYPGDPANLMPAEVASDDSYDRFVTIMRRINTSLFPAFEPDSRVMLYALIVFQWLKGKSLAEIIRQNIAWHDKVGKMYSLPVIIRDTMALVEQIARFRAPKYLSTYIDILHLYYNEIGRDDLIDRGLDIGTQLEFGVSSRTLISLMELGLSRMTAVALYEKISRDDLDQAQALKWITDRNDQLEGMELPVVIVRELRERLRIARR